MLKKLHRNIAVIFGLAFFQCFMVIVPVVVPFFMSKGLSLAEIFYLQAVFATTIVLLEAPSGYFADIFGRRFALIIGSIVHGLSYFLLNFADDFLSLMIFEITAGISMSLLSGADLALLYDTQLALEDDDSAEHARGIAHLGFIKSGAEGIGALLGGALALYSFDLMVLIQSIIAWVCLALAVLLVEPPYRREAAGSGFERVRISAILRHLLINDPVLRQIVIATPLYNLAIFQVAWLVQPYWEAQGLSLALFGVLWCLQSLAVALANKFGLEVERRYGAVFALALIGILPILGQFGMAWFQGWVGIGIGLILFVCRGLNQVILVNALNRRVPSEFRATANSFTSFLLRLAFITTGPIVGFVAEREGLATALNLLGISSIALGLFVMIPLMQSVREIQQRVAA
ncbi:MAG: MFS transporter [Gammaproteobacteria bacterium]|nr:MFS transporter [Gammaproteobacteria bacterium]MDD9896292.1 MFS transporter [Gammaproteobacteria bacterium]